MNIYFKDDNFYNLERQEGLFYLTAKAVHEGGPVEGTNIKFILDTGAYMTVISRGTAISIGFDKLPKTKATLFGFGGGIDVDFVRIPGLKILNKLLTNVPVLIPHDMYRIHPNTGEKKQMPEVLGLNVLEYYNYYIDTERSRLYLSENSVPRFYSNALESGQAFIAGTAELCYNLSGSLSR
jgi:hypothetical protein